MSMSIIITFLQQLEFISPWVFALFPLPFIVRMLIAPASKQEVSLLSPLIISRVEADTSQVLSPNAKQHGIPIFYFALWMLLITAAARPVLFLKPTSFNSTGKDMILAVDLSGSMEKEDMRVQGHSANRLVSVKYVVEEFIKKREGDRLGLVVFGSQAFIQSPLTYDLQTVNKLLQESEIGMAGNNTAIGEAIGITLKHLANSQQQKAVLILLTDGSNTAGVVSPLDAANQANKAGLKIYTIGIGKANTSSIEAFLSNGNSMNVAILKKIAHASGGKFYLASDTRELNNIYDEINRLEQSEHQIHQYRLRTELYHYPLAIVFLLSLLITGYRLRGGG